MKKRFLFLLIVLFVFLNMKCSEDIITSSNDQSLYTENSLESNVVEVNIADIKILNGALTKANGETNNALINEIRLKYFAKALAVSLKNPELCKMLKNEIGKKFDGDYDVLWKTVKDYNVKDKGKIRNIVGKKFIDGLTLNIMDEIEKVPLLQIALPVNYDKWDGESTILVTYRPLTIDDMELREICAYDADMNEYILDAKTEPDFPVMVVVVGINERIEYYKGSSLQSEKSLSKVTSNGRSTEEILYRIKIFKDGEGWLGGDPEIYIVSAGTNSIYDRKERVNLPSVNKTGKWYYLDKVLFDWETEYWGTHTGYAVLEYDPSIYNYSVNILVDYVEVKVKNKDNDDFIGNIYSIPYNHTITEDYAFDDVQMRLIYNE